MLDAADRQIMLEAVGVIATVSGGTLLVTPPEYGDPQVMYSSDEIVTMNPYCHAAYEDLHPLSISGGESGTLITIESRQYRVLAIKDISSGFCSMELGAV